MLKVENVEVLGWEHAIRGMRNPKNSWAKSDSGPECPYGKEKCCGECQQNFCIGPNDKQLMMALRNAGTDHRKFMRMITVYLDITAPLYWWKEFDTYKVGTVANSCSTMHKIAAKSTRVCCLTSWKTGRRSLTWQSQPGTPRFRKRLRSKSRRSTKS